MVQGCIPLNTVYKLIIYWQKYQLETSVVKTSYNCCREFQLCLTTRNWKYNTQISQILVLFNTQNNFFQLQPFRNFLHTKIKLILYSCVYISLNLDFSYAIETDSIANGGLRKLYLAALFYPTQKIRKSTAKRNTCSLTIVSVANLR